MLDVKEFKYRFVTVVRTLSASGASLLTPPGIGLRLRTH